MISAALSFLGGSGGKILLAAVALMTWTAWNRIDAASGARAKAENACQAAVAERTAAEIARQREGASEAVRAAVARAAQSERERDELRKRLAGLLAETGGGGPGCIIPDVLLNELRGIR